MGHPWRNVRRGLPLLARLTLGLAALFGQLACDDPQSEDKGKVSRDARPPDAAPPPVVPGSPTEVLARLPDLPKPAVAGPGDPASAIKIGHPEIERSALSARIYQGNYPGEPFNRVTYLIGPDDRIRSVTMQLDPAYSHPLRRAALIEAAEARLQKGEAMESPPYVGRRWAELRHRIELRRDTHTDQMELLFHVEGARPLPVP